MEIRIYRNFDARTNNKPLYVARVECPDTFSFERALSVFKSIYGTCLVEFLCV